MRSAALILVFLGTLANAVDVISGGAGDGTVVIQQDRDHQWSIGDKVCVGKNKTDCGEVIKATALEATIKLSPRSAVKVEKKATAAPVPVAKKKVSAPSQVAVETPEPTPLPAPAKPRPAPVTAAKRAKRKEAGTPDADQMHVHPYRLTIEGETTFNDPSPPPQIMDDRVARTAPLGGSKRDVASANALKWHFGAALDLGGDYMIPGFELGRALSQSTALGVHVVYNYQEERGAQRIVGAMLTGTYFFSETGTSALFAETRVGAYSLAAKDSYGEESTSSIAFGQVFGWRARVMPILSLSAAVGLEYLNQADRTRILQFSGLKPLVSIAVNILF